MSDDPGKSPFATTNGAEKNQRRGAQFSLGQLMLILTVVTAATAPLAYLARALRGSRDSQFAFILICLAAPTLVLIVVSAIYQLLAWKKRRKS